MAGLAFMWILGFSWIFGLLGMVVDHIALQYLFTIFTLGEGAFIFVHYCLRSTHVREAYLLSSETKLTRRQITMLNAKAKDYSSSHTSGAKKTGTTGVGAISETEGRMSMWDLANDEPMMSSQPNTDSYHNRPSAVKFKMPRLSTKSSSSRVVTFSDDAPQRAITPDAIDETSMGSRASSRARLSPCDAATPPTTPPSPSRHRTRRFKRKNQVACSSDDVVIAMSSSNPGSAPQTPVRSSPWQFDDSYDDDQMFSPPRHKSSTPISPSSLSANAHFALDGIAEEIDISAPGTPESPRRTRSTHHHGSSSA